MFEEDDGWKFGKFEFERGTPKENFVLIRSDRTKMNWGGLLVIV